MTRLFGGKAEPRVVDLRKLFASHSEAGAFEDLVNLEGVASEYSFSTKSGEVTAVIAFRGPDAECMDPTEVEFIRSRCRTALRAFDERFIVGTYLMKRSRPELVDGGGGTPTVQRILRDRHQFLSANAFLTVTLKPAWKSSNLIDRIVAFLKHPADGFRRAFGVESAVTTLREGIEANCRILEQAARSFIKQTELNATLLTTEEAFAFYRRILNPDPRKAAAVQLRVDDPISLQIVDSELECHRDHLRLDDYFIKTLTQKRLPASTFANMLADLASVKANLVIATEWSAIESNAAVGEIRARRRHAHNTKVSLGSHLGERRSEREIMFDESKEAVVRELGECMTDVELRGVQLGYFSLTVIVMATSIEEARDAAAAVMKVFGLHDGALNEERYNGLNAFLAALPAGHPYNLRRMIVTDENHSDLVPWFLPAVGEKRNEHLDASCLAAFETENDSLYHFNFHVQDVAHTLILGATGSGKSFLANFLLNSALQYSPFVFIFDIGGSYRWFTELHGGVHVPFRASSGQFRINPFSLAPTPENLEFLFSFVRLLVESDGYRMPDADSRELYEAICAVYHMEREQRRLLTLASISPKSVAQRLRRWIQGEQYGEWFDHVDDTVTFSELQYIDFEGMERLGVVLEPLLFYLLHRVNDFVLDPSLGTRLKLAVVDEAWLFLRNRTTCDYIVSAMRTWRKRNAGMILSTQSLVDLSAADVFQPVLDSCPTKLLLSSPALNAKFYIEALRLNEVEIDKVRQLAPKRQFLLKRDTLSKVLNLETDSRSYWLFTTNAYEAKRRQELVDAVGLTAALDSLSGGSL
jgi:type IV secretion system protein TrbE